MSRTPASRLSFPPRSGNDLEANNGQQPALLVLSSSSRPSRSLSLLLLLLACVPVTSRTTYVRELEQVGVVPGPSAPHVIGPLTDRGKVSLEGDFSMAPTTAPAASREQGAPGQYTASDWARLMATFGVRRWFNLGFGVEAAPRILSRPLATDLPRRTEEDVFRTTSWLRLRGTTDPGIFFEGQLETQIAAFTYHQTETLTVTETSYGASEDDGNLFSTGNDETTVDVDVSHASARKAALYLTVRAGTAIGWSKPGVVDLSLGVGVENVPYLYGYRRQEWSCTVREDGSDRCTFKPWRPLAIRTALGRSVTLAVGVPVQGTSLTLLGAGHLFSITDPLAPFSRFGADVGVRWTPGQPW